jgi:peptidoglycan/xylan/chitin deacetylase (PgdA/CDA1 family)
MIPFRTPFFLPYIYPTLLWRQKPEEKSLYLTFDDGPVPGPTEFALETLASASAKATFFCIGDNIRKYPQVFKKISEAGHAIGNHTFNHLNGWKTSTQKYLTNIQQCQLLLEQGTKSKTDRDLFRPPYGRIAFSQIKMLGQYRIVMWDVLTHDYNKAMSPEYCLRNAVRATRAGSIVVFHDSLKAERNMTYVLPRYLDHFGSQGYSFKIISA